MALEEKKHTARRQLLIFMSIVSLTGAMGCIYRWAMRPPPMVMSFFPWKWEWDTSGTQWARDVFGPIILQWDGLDDPAWNRAGGDRSQLEVFWQARERYCRLRLLCFLTWAGSAMMLVVWSQRNNVARIFHGRENRSLMNRHKPALIALVMSIPLFHGMYQWATFPEKHIVCPPRANAMAFYQAHRLSSDIKAKAARSAWMADWDRSGMKWARDNYGPVLLQCKFVARDEWWEPPWHEGAREHSRWIWRQFETTYRLSALLAVLWAGFIGTFIYCSKRSAGVKREDLRAAR
jgi:hypothetical protein